MKINSLAQWFGSNRMLAEQVGKAIGKVRWCGVPFCGACPELPFIQTRTGVANDLHCHIINLARVVQSEIGFGALVGMLDGLLFHPVELAAAQGRCKRAAERHEPGQIPVLRWAADYFVCTWMGRGGSSGTGAEFQGGPSVRWEAAGGDSVTRFRNAVAGLPAWHDALLPWTFVCMDALSYIGKLKDRDGHAIYVDPPWPKVGAQYAHGMSDTDHTILADMLGQFKKTRVVVRYGDHPLIRDLYSGSQWRWQEGTSRDQANNPVSEGLIISN